VTEDKDKHDTAIALLRQSIERIREDVSKVQQSMENFLKRLEEGYVPRREHEELKKDHAQLENRFYALVVGFAMMAIKMVVDTFSTR